WYAIEWANVRIFGPSEFALRLPAAVCSIIAVLLVWRLALAIDFDRRTAFIAGLMAAILPGALYYAQDARMYPLLSCFVLGAALAAIRENWVAFAICGAGAMYTQNLGALYIGAMGLAILIGRIRAIRTMGKPIA